LPASPPDVDVEPLSPAEPLSPVDFSVDEVAGALPSPDPLDELRLDPPPFPDDEERESVL
jgi:hypothetical protein